jgi:antitoxin component YwqK of YwqJK toxin-antitoxin module
MRKIVLVIAVCVSFLACEKKKRNSVFEYYKDGAFKSITPYDSGHINGQVQWFYPNSKIEQIVNFKSGKENGNAYYFYKSGALKNFRNWKEGKMVGQ